MTEITHVYSHLIDNNENINHNIKIAKMTAKYGNRITDILNGNKMADAICNVKYTPLKLDLNNYFLPEYVIIKEDTIIEAPTNKFFLSETISKLKQEWTTKRANFLEHETIDFEATFKQNSKFQDLLQHNAQKLILTKERAYNYYCNNTNIINSKLDQRRETYNSSFCKFCTTISLDNHDHGNNSCKISLEYHNFLQNAIFSIVMNHSKSTVPKIPIWFIVPKNLGSPTTQLNFPTELGNKGFIPKELNNFFKTNQVNNKKH